eukprot:TRINITY_DN2701_c0_g1_i1.p1 TRINITY_DN2701_c0_g1~~TRINITY_DN2701_c0_g1_i1.p1  ORF type:complete len:210 (+),score=50.23 TRINITY_DN2701_c0_g1_i1:35-631(+)
MGNNNSAFLLEQATELSKLYLFVQQNNELLFKGPKLESAITKYINFMNDLPNSSQNSLINVTDNEILWVWYLHCLDHESYTKDCFAAFGNKKLIDKSKIHSTIILLSSFTPSVSFEDIIKYHAQFIIKFKPIVNLHFFIFQYLNFLRNNDFDSLQKGIINLKFIFFAHLFCPSIYEEHCEHYIGKILYYNPVNGKLIN